MYAYGDRIFSNRNFSVELFASDSVRKMDRRSWFFQDKIWISKYSQSTFFQEKDDKF